jgi:outer membrane protein OmpA-like peptidoglycan-associated protein
VSRGMQCPGLGTLHPTRRPHCGNKEALDVPDSIPQSVLDKADRVVVLPSVLKFANRDYRQPWPPNSHDRAREVDMQRHWKTVLLLAMSCISPCAVAQQAQQEVPASDTVKKTVTAIGYPAGKSIEVDLTGTGLMAAGSGQAKVKAGTGATGVETEFQSMAQATTFGTEFLTYVLWAVSPDGRSNNLGEILINKDGKGKLTTTTAFQTFSLFVTAEPYFAVRFPSEMVVLQNELKKNTKAKIFPVNDYPLMRRSQYQKMGNPLALTLDLKNVPLNMYEARNAVEIAQSRGADKYAPEIFSKAKGSLQMAENSLAQKENEKVIISNARQTVQFAEDARRLTEQRKEEERIANEKAAAAATAKSEAESKAAAEAAEAKRKSDTEAQRQADLAAAKQAKLKAAQDAAQADAERSRKAAADLRAQLLEQFNRVLTTRDTPRGLVVNMGDVLFATGKYDLRPEAQIVLAKLSGIILSHPGLNLAVEGYTDSVGSDDFNLKLSQQRADTVRDYLVTQGLQDSSVTANGFGKADPVADNDTPAGRQQNRRVEIVVSGEIIGAKIGR